MKRQEISILIPVYNEVCTPLVEALANLCEQEAQQQAGFSYEIIVGDNASTDKDALTANRRINGLKHCRLIENEQNAGRAANRNGLARASQYQWLLFLDCDVELPTDGLFLQRYLEAPEKEVVVGGFNLRGESSNLRFRYESAFKDSHPLTVLNSRPHQHLRSTNFMIARQTLLDTPFDERLTMKYGYEDVLLGKHLKSKDVSIEHIDNPVIISDFEPNDVYVGKVERALDTLHEFRDDLRGYSRLLTFADSLRNRWFLRTGLRLWHRLFGRLERRYLSGSKPSLKVLKLYRMGYFLTITNNR